MLSYAKIAENFRKYGLVKQEDLIPVTSLTIITTDSSSDFAAILKSMLIDNLDPEMYGYEKRVDLFDKILNVLSTTRICRIEVLFTKIVEIFNEYQYYNIWNSGEELELVYGFCMQFWTIPSDIMQKYLTEEAPEEVTEKEEVQEPEDDHLNGEEASEE